MGYSELHEFGRQVVVEAREEAVESISLYLAGRYGSDHPMVPCWQREMPDEQRLAIANALVHAVDTALTEFMAFLEFRIGSGDVSLGVKHGATEYRVRGTDPLRSWYGAWVDDFGKSSGADLVERAKVAGQQRAEGE